MLFHYNFKIRFSSTCTSIYSFKLHLKLPTIYSQMTSNEYIRKYSPLYLHLAFNASGYDFIKCVHYSYPMAQNMK